MKCNLDCDYCPTGLYGGHDNSQSHPKLEDCLATIDFMFRYADHAMSQRRTGLRTVVLNVYGGESLNHPHIAEILSAVRQRHEPYANSWALKVTTTTNAILSQKRLASVIPLIDEFTVSYHTNNTDKQKSLFRSNILRIHAAGRAVKCVVLMHSEPELFADAQQQIAWCEQHQIRHLPRQLDRAPNLTQFDYAPQQVQWFKKLYDSRSHNTTCDLEPVDEKTNLTAQGRACCGGRQLVLDSNQRQRHFYVNNTFPNWYCSVDRFFLYIKQTTGEVFVNKDCKMNYQGEVGPIGTLDRWQDILDQQQQPDQHIQCKKARCTCGLCAPKAQDLATYKTIMRKYLTCDI